MAKKEIFTGYFLIGIYNKCTCNNYCNRHHFYYDEAEESQNLFDEVCIVNSFTAFIIIVV